jgi:hypothetical protein
VGTHWVRWDDGSDLAQIHLIYKVTSVAGDLVRLECQADEWGSRWWETFAANLFANYRQVELVFPSQPQETVTLPKPPKGYEYVLRSKVDW